MTCDYVYYIIIFISNLASTCFFFPRSSFIFVSYKVLEDDEVKHQEMEDDKLGYQAMNKEEME